MREVAGVVVMSKTRWEYEHAYSEVDDDAELDQVLKDRGSQGWELVSVVEQADEDNGDRHLHMFFKRPAD